jgi:type II secretory pathway component GspD/PulD (secretin)
VRPNERRCNPVSRPQLRVRTGAQARFSVGQQVPVLGAMSQDNKGNPIQSVEYRQSGTIFTVRPDIRDQVVDLDISQELSSFVATTTGVNNSPTLLQRTASSQLSIKPGEVVVFAGLEESRDDNAGSSFFGFSLGSRKNNAASEVLLFIEAQSI